MSAVGGVTVTVKDDFSVVDPMIQMGEFADAFIERAEADGNFIISTYDLVSDYIVTDCFVTTFTDLFTRYAGYTVDEIMPLKGKNVLGEEFYAFYADGENWMN